MISQNLKNIFDLLNRRTLKTAEGEEEECDKETYLAQGKYELRHGDPKRALFYLDKAVSNNKIANKQPDLMH